LCFST
jgi:hypothetical protein